MEARSAKSVSNFPYDSKSVCYIEVMKDGTVAQGGGKEVYERVKEGRSVLYAVWPGDWKSDLFVIDDLDAYGSSIGVINQPSASGLENHKHVIEWRVNEYERNPRGTYILVDVVLKCGCEIKNIREFAKQTNEQLGWNVAKTSGWSGGGNHGDGSHNEYTVTVQRTTLGPKDKT